MDDDAFYGAHVRPGSSGGVKTSETGKVVLGARGVAFVYRVYYGTWLLNVTVGPPGFHGCVLIRAAEPLEGSEWMRRRRNTSDPVERLLAGPGRLTRALGIDGSMNGHAMRDRPLGLLPAEHPPRRLVTGPRIGVKRAKHLSWRFADPDSASLSRKTGLIAEADGSP